MNIELSEAQKDQLSMAIGDIHAADSSCLPKEVCQYLSASITSKYSHQNELNKKICNYFDKTANLYSFPTSS